MTLVLVACILLVIQSFLTVIQVHYYQKSMKSLIEKYKGEEGIYLFTGQCRRKLSSGSIAMLVVNENYVIQECKVMRGISILSTFKDLEKYKNQHVGELLNLLNDLEKKDAAGKAKKKKAVEAALSQAGERALLSIAEKKHPSQKNDALGA
ncbi:transcriptional regulator GutM [Bacillus sp. NSP9.1]|uniref:transcriptional regulator GutM n=1 Tax=Bacillus sp. NSP9.1 TaxID=1071078 RepID=UPI0003F90B57|nr:transcriptional regulator GutM [Bacillus sp. NSP9.1]QHZ48458.1 transcriptional regulator [Bacillus sp. NSP9.1]